MKKDGSIAKTVFSSIDTVVSTVEAIHGDIAGIRGNKNGNEIQRKERRENVYGVIRSISDRIGTVVSGFIR